MLALMLSKSLPLISVTAFITIHRPPPATVVTSPATLTPHLYIVKATSHPLRSLIRASHDRITPNDWGNEGGPIAPPYLVLLPQATLRHLTLLSIEVTLPNPSVLVTVALNDFGSVPKHSLR